MPKFELKEEEFATKYYEDIHGGKVQLSTVTNEHGYYLGQCLYDGVWMSEYFEHADIVGYWEDRPPDMIDDREFSFHTFYTKDDKEVELIPYVRCGDANECYVGLVSNGVFQVPEMFWKSDIVRMERK